MRYGATSFQHWMSQEYSYVALDTEMARETPYFSIGLLDPEHPRFGIGEIALEYAFQVASTRPHLWKGSHRYRWVFCGSFIKITRCSSVVGVCDVLDTRSNIV